MPGPNDEQQGHRDDQDRQAADLWAQILRQELRHRKTSRDLFEEHERIIGMKVRQLRTERGWTQNDLARRLDQIGWPLDQTTLSNLELGRRPVRVAETVALAMAFGLPALALWALPVAGEPWSIAAMRRRLRDIDRYISTLEDHLHTSIIGYADQQFERLRLVEAINEAAKADSRGELEDMDLDADKTQALVEGLDPESHDRYIRSLPPEDPARSRYAQLDAIKDGEPQRLAAEAFRMYQAGTSPEEIGKFLARSMPRGILDPLVTAAEIIRESLAPAWLAPPERREARQGSPGEGG